MKIPKSVTEYEDFIYDLPNEYPQIKMSTLILKRGKLVGEVSGSILFENDVRLNVKELIDFRYGTIKTYSYEVYVGHEKQYWYDPQPHPDDPSLKSTFPHHKHVPPNIKHNRIPVKGLSFEKENITFLIKEILDQFFNLS
jgi:hypothetical protein